jgi:hypothetical protein
MPCKLAFDGFAPTRISQARARIRRYHGGKDALSERQRTAEHKLMMFRYDSLLSADGIQIGAHQFLPRCLGFVLSFISDRLFDPAPRWQAPP